MRLGSFLRRRPSAAIVISSLALFLSAGGVGYAAITLPAGSVGNAQLRNGSVSYKKIRPNTVGNVRANIGQIQERVGGTCANGAAIGAINKLGKVTCNPALPSAFGTTSNTADVPSTATRSAARSCLRGRRIWRSPTRRRASPAAPPPST